MLEAVLAAAVALSPVSSAALEPPTPREERIGRAMIENAKIDDAEFLRITAEAIAERADRRLTEEEFALRASRPETVVLDARSRSYYDLLHLRGARSLPFTEFTAESLANLIPDRTTPILIYCNNNFVGAELEFATKALPAALNLSTFVALRAYGYENVWELGPLLDIRETELALAGENAANYLEQPRGQS
jgi:hypothetical protein